MPTQTAYAQRLQTAIRNFHQAGNAAAIEALYILLDEFHGKDKAEYNREEINLVAACCCLLGKYREAHALLAGLEAKTRKEVKNMTTYECLAQTWGTRSEKKRPGASGKKRRYTLPVFRYCPDPLGSEIFKDDWSVQCESCGKETPVYYDGPFYSVEEVTYLCPKCIHNGKAAEKFNGEFQEDLLDDTGVTNPARKDEILHRTPGYTSWQGNFWPAHCDDYCAFAGYVGANEITELGIWDTLVNLTGMELEFLQETLTKDASLSGYLFRCLECGVYVLYADCD